MRRMCNVGAALIAVAVLAAGVWSQPVLAREQAAAGANVEKEAIAALEKMGGYLRSLKAFQVEAVTTNEEVLETGQKVQFAGVVNALARMPDRLRIAMTSDRRDRLFMYDGKQFTMLAQRVNFYATVPAPATIGQLADELDTKHGINLPLEDLFRWGGKQSPTAGITSAMFVGPSQIDGVSCGHYAFRQEGLDWQVWIQMGDFPLPRRLVLTTMTDEARPQYTATLNWNLAPSFNDAAFTFVAPRDAGRVVLAGVK
jgi:hypothetical protein